MGFGMYIGKHVDNSNRYNNNADGDDQDDDNNSNDNSWNKK